MNMSLGEMWSSMGFVAKTVVVLLLLLSIYSISVMIEKFVNYRTSKKQSIEFLPTLIKLLKENQVQKAIDVAKGANYKKAHIAKVVSAGLTEYQTQQSGVAQNYDRIGAIRRATDMQTVLTNADMKRGLAGLGTIGATAPFIGLFGTVMGIVNAFTGMATSGSGGLASVSAGIAEALFTTAIGLVVAIPAVMAFNYFTDRLERYTIEMNNASQELIDFFLKKQGA
ncbi:MAG TPA: MotA/TolQ/ExbB proton channel family protein [Acidobacteriota bacterium]|nr:MotA/TolQ/ExbB proton channel family protein [Acidobacteriota bacterium]